MAQPNTLHDLMKTRGIVGAIRWRDAEVGKAGAAQPVLLEQLGFPSESRARHFMLAAGAYGHCVQAIAQLNVEFREDFRENISPLDAIYIHGYKFSMVASWNRVAALIDNAINVDIQNLTRQIVLVENK